MPLNDLVKEYSLRTVADKTNISANTLKKLQNREWEKLQKTQVLGFLNIIEREYNLDLHELKEDASAYFKEHKAAQSNNPIDIVGVANIKSDSKIISGLVTLVTLALVAYATWFYLSEHKKSSEQNSTMESSSQHSKGMFEETLSSVKSILGIQSNISKSSNVVTTDINSSVREKKSRESNVSAVTNRANTLTQVTQSKESIDSQSVESAIKEESNTTEQPADENKKFNIVLPEVSQTQEANNSTEVQAIQENTEANKTVTTETENSNEQNIDNEENSSQEELKSTDTITDENSSIIVEPDATEERSDKNITVPPEASLSKVTIKPLSKRLWIGIYDLQRKKRLNKFITKEIELPINGEFAIITGHNRLQITPEGGEALKFRKKGRVYLIISKNGIKEIDRAEYKRVTNNQAW